MKNIFGVLTLVLVFMSSCSVGRQSINHPNSNKSISANTDNTMQTNTNNSVPTYTIETSMGNIKVLLYEETPLHKANFERLIEEQTLDSTLFHRVIKDFMIQGGDPDTRPAVLRMTRSVEKDREMIAAEFNPKLIHKKGALAAARTGDHMNPEKKSSPFQFYIVQGRVFAPEQLDAMQAMGGFSWTEEQKEIYTTIGGTPHLDGGYTVFGEVVEGLEIMEQIANVETGNMDRPVENVYILRIVKD